MKTCFGVSALSVVALGAAMGVLGVGCTASRDHLDEETRSSESSIINGVEHAGDPGIMALYGQVPGQEGGSLCTTTLIAPTVLITAAHCVAREMFTAGEPTFLALEGTKLREPATIKKHKVKEVHWDTAFDKNAPQNGHDIGVAILEEAITDITPYPFNRAAVTADTNGRDLRIVGYGLADGFEQFGGGGGDGGAAESSAGVKRMATTKQRSVSDLTIGLGASSLFGTLSGEANICSGDSGGPVLAKLNGVETIVAVNSYGLIACLGESQATRVDLYLPFIQQYVP